MSPGCSSSTAAVLAITCLLSLVSAAAAGRGFSQVSLPAYAWQRDIMYEEVALCSKLECYYRCAAAAAADDGGECVAMAFGARGICQLGSRVLAADGVVDLQQAAAVGRKGRLGHDLTVLCRPEQAEALAETCLAEFASIGLRLRIAERRILAREEEERGGVTIKNVNRPGGGRTGKPAADDIAAEGGDYAARMALRRRLEDEGS